MTTRLWFFKGGSVCYSNILLDIKYKETEWYYIITSLSTKEVIAEYPEQLVKHAEYHEEVHNVAPRIMS